MASRAARTGVAIATGTRNTDGGKLEECVMWAWLHRRRQRPTPLATMSPAELDAALADHPELAHLLRNTLGVMQFAPPQTADAVIARVGALVERVLAGKLSASQEHEAVMSELAAIRRELHATPPARG